MAEEKKLKKQSKPLAVRQVDLTTPQIKARLDRIAEATKSESFHAGTVLKLGFITFAADIVGLEPETEERAAFIAQLNSTPGWFGTGNNSACRQAFERKTGVAKVAADYGAF